MAALCSTSEHCESDIRQRLAKAGMSASDIQAVVSSLYAEGFLHAARYCRAFASDQMRFSRWGPAKIAAALRQKGLPAADIQQAIAELPAEELQDVLRQVIGSKIRQTTNPTREKLLRFAASRGFAYDDAAQAIQQLLD